MSIDGAPSIGGKRVLIVEDEAFVAMALESAFEQAGAHVIGTAATLDEAIGFARTAQIDGAVLDIDLAGLDVYPAADILVERGIPFIFQTGHGQRRELQVNYPHIHVCKKPVGQNDLIAALAEAL